MLTMHIMLTIYIIIYINYIHMYILTIYVDFGCHDEMHVGLPSLFLLEGGGFA